MKAYADRFKTYIDTDSGLKVLSSNRVTAWQHFRNICKEKKLKVPTFDKVKLFEGDEKHYCSCSFVFIMRDRNGTAFCGSCKKIVKEEI